MLTNTPRDHASQWAVAKPVGQVDLVLDALVDQDDPVQNLSAAVRVGDTMFLGSDEGVSLERLHRDGDSWTGHERLSLADYLPIDRSNEADIEGLAVDDGWLWVLGSHARTRPKIENSEDERIDIEKFSDLKDTRPRCLIARLPLIEDPKVPGAYVLVERDGDRHAGLLKRTAKGNSLGTMLAHDPLIKPFTRIPAKEGGVDLEGIAVAGSRIALGMRGPVIQGFAVLLEMTLTAKASGRLKLASTPRKRLLDLDGLGIRDLKRDGNDLLILAGPTTSLDGPCTVYRWNDWLHDPAEHDRRVCLHRPVRILELPFGRGDDHPEGLALLDTGKDRTELLVVCDSPSSWRFDRVRRSLKCDRFAL